jgi:hypothetical protein
MKYFFCSLALLLASSALAATDQKIKSKVSIPSKEFAMQLAEVFGSGFATLKAIQCETGDTLETLVTCSLGAKEWTTLTEGIGHMHIFNSVRAKSANELFDKMNVKSGLVKVTDLGEGGKIKTTEYNSQQGTYSLACHRGSEIKETSCTFIMYAAGR